MRSVGAGMDFQMDDITDQTVMIAIQGPEAAKTLQPLIPLPLAEMKRFTHTFSTVKGIDSVITRTGYTGEDGFEIIVHDAAQGAMGVWEALIANGARPCALGARDSLRLEAGLPLYGSDMDEGTNPLEADLGWVVSKDKQGYVGWEKLASLAKQGPDKVRRGVVMEERIPRRDFKVTDQTGDEIGVVTSGDLLPRLEERNRDGVRREALLRVRPGRQGRREGRSQRRQDREVPRLRRDAIRMEAQAAAIVKSDTSKTPSV